MSNKKTYDFKGRNELGKLGEKIVLEYLNGNNKIKSVIDVSKIPRYQMLDIDLIVEFFSGEKYTIEVKTDSYDSGNLFLELLGDIEQYRLGCLIATEADFLFYYFLNTKELYVFKTKKLLAWVLLNIDKLQKRTVNNKWGNNNYHSYGVLLPKNIIESNMKFYNKLIIG